MAARRPQLVTMYVLSLAATIALLVVWVVYVVRSASRLAALGRRVGVAGERTQLDPPRGRLRAALLPHRRTHLPARPGAGGAPLRAEAGRVRLQRHPRDEVAAGRDQAARPDPAEPAGLRGRGARGVAAPPRAAGRPHGAGWSTTCSRAAACSPASARSSCGRSTSAPSSARYFAEARPRASRRAASSCAGRLGAAVSVLASDEALRRVMDNLLDNAVRFSQPRRRGALPASRDGRARWCASRSRTTASASRRRSCRRLRPLLPGRQRARPAPPRHRPRSRRSSPAWCGDARRGARRFAGRAAGQPLRGRAAGVDERLVSGIEPPRSWWSRTRRRSPQGLRAQPRAQGARRRAGARRRGGPAAGVRGARFDLILLDVRLPEVDGFEVSGGCARRATSPPSSCSPRATSPTTSIFGLKLGADDYVVKPFDLGELLARVESLLRRQAWSRAASGGAEGRPAPQRHAFGDYWVDFATYEAKTREGVVAAVAEGDRRAARLPRAARPGGHPPRAAGRGLAAAAPPQQAGRRQRHRRAAQAFEESAGRPRHILSVRGVGYRFVP